MSIEEKFFAAVDVIDNLPGDGTFQPSEDLMLKLCAYYMQATQGSCKISKPSIWNYSSRIKWNAWNDLGNMDREIAMEKYVEELTKVIETMSYNENVSKFMSLIGPFYEVVSSEEDVQSDEGSSKKNPTEYLYPVKDLEDLNVINIGKSKKNSVNIDYGLCSSQNPNLRTEKQYKHDCSSGNTKYAPRQSIVDIFKSKTNFKHQAFVSHQDMLILTIINLQNSLEDVVKKLDNLQCLAKSADFNCETKDEDQKPVKWNLGYSATAMALLWPIAVNLCSRGF